MNEILLIGAGVVSAVFGVLILADYLQRRRPQQAAWGLALAMFSIATLLAARGIASGFSPGLYRTYYLLGAMLNVPVLAVGTIYLIAARKIGHAASAVVAVACIYAAGAVFSGAVRTAGLGIRGRIPAGRQVMPHGVVLLARYYPITGFVIVFSAALWSAWRMARKPNENLRRIAQGNILIAVGTLIAAVASEIARTGHTGALAPGLLAGITAMFAGFLKARSAGTAPRPNTITE